MISVSNPAAATVVMIAQVSCRIVHNDVEITTFDAVWSPPQCCSKLTELGKRGILLM
jgi:hypothetical protein